MKLVLNGVDPPRICQECPCFHQIQSYITKTLGQYCMAAKRTLREPKEISKIVADMDNWTNTEIPEWCPGEGVNLWL